MPSEWDEEFVKQRLDQLIREHNLSVPSGAFPFCRRFAAADSLE
jgi:hypothetical protein